MAVCTGMNVVFFFHNTNLPPPFPEWRMKSIKMRREVNVSHVFMAPQAARVSTGIGTE